MDYNAGMFQLNFDLILLLNAIHFGVCSRAVPNEVCRCAATHNLETHQHSKLASVSADS